MCYPAFSICHFNLNICYLSKKKLFRNLINKKFPMFNVFGYHQIWSINYKWKSIVFNGSSTVIPTLFLMVEILNHSTIHLHNPLSLNLFSICLWSLIVTIYLLSSLVVLNFVTSFASQIITLKKYMCIDYLLRIS